MITTRKLEKWRCLECNHEWEDTVPAKEYCPHPDCQLRQHAAGEFSRFDRIERALILANGCLISTKDIQPTRKEAYTEGFTLGYKQGIEKGYRKGQLEPRDLEEEDEDDE